VFDFLPRLVEAFAFAIALYASDFPQKRRVELRLCYVEVTLELGVDDHRFWCFRLDKRFFLRLWEVHELAFIVDLGDNVEFVLGRLFGHLVGDPF